MRICCSPELPAIDTLTPEERQRFGFLVYQLRKSGRDVKTAQAIYIYPEAYSQGGTRADSTPYSTEPASLDGLMELQLIPPERFVAKGIVTESLSTIPYRLFRVGQQRDPGWFSVPIVATGNSQGEKGNCRK